MKLHFGLSAIILPIVFWLGIASAHSMVLKNDSVQLYKQGNYLLKKGEFAEALKIWKTVLEKSPNNSDVNFKIGLCYRNSWDEQLKALPYFKKAIAKMTGDYDFSNNKTGAAPYDALYFLAETFLTANKPDSALTYFKYYHDKYLGKPPINVERYLFICINAKNSVKNPRAVKIKSLGKTINTDYSETSPVVKLDNSMLFFSSRRPGTTNKIDKITGLYSEDIYISTKDAGGKWKDPEPFRFNTGYDERPLFISPDGLTLYFCRNDKGNFDIYQSHFADGVWNAPKSLSEINSSGNETGLSITADGKQLFFCSDREGGIGKFDIYRCEKKANGRWGVPENIGGPVNTELNEISPYINPNGKTLFFSSNGSPNQGSGGYDVYYSELQKDNYNSWGAPQTMGYPINKTRDDIDYYIITGGKRYYATQTDNSSYDLFEVEGGTFDVEAVDATAEVVTVTKEMNVTEVIETEKKVEKEVDVVQTVETEVEVVKEVNTVDTAALNELKLSAEKKLEMAKAEAEKLKAEAEIAAAERAKANEEIAKANEQIAKSNAEKAKADAVIAEAEKSKAEEEKLKHLAVIAEADRTCAEAEITKAKAAIAASEKSKADAEKAKADLATAKIWKKTAKQKAKVAEADLAKLEVEKAKIKAESDKLEADKLNAKAENEKAEAQKALAASESQKAESQKIEAKALSEKALADKAAADATKAKYDADKAETEKATAEAMIKTKAIETEKAKFDATKANAEAERTKAEADREQAKTDAAKAAAARASAEADKAKAEQEKVKELTNKTIAEAEVVKAKAKAMSENAEAAKATAKAESAKAEAAKEQAKAELAKAAAAKASSDAEKTKAAAEKAKAELEKTKAEAAKMKSEADKSKAEAEKAKAEAAKAKAEAAKTASGKTN